MNRVYSGFENLIKNVRLKTSFLATCIMCMLAHSYSYFNVALKLDRERWFTRYLINSKSMLATGKWFANIPGVLRQGAYLPWLSGIITVIMLAFSVYMICVVLKVDKGLSVWLIAGLVVTDCNIIMAHFYTPYDYAFALLCACASAWIWSRNDLKIAVRIPVGAAGIMLCLGVYGAYASAATTLVIIALFASLLDGDKPEELFKRGIEYVGTFLLGMGIYYAVLRILLSGSKTQMTPYMGEDKLVNGADSVTMLSSIRAAYFTPVKRYLGIYEEEYRLMPQWLAVTIVIVVVIMACIMIRSRYSLKKDMRSYLLILFLALVFPLSAGAIYVMSFGYVHILMTFTFVLFYVGALKLSEMFAAMGGNDKRLTYVKSILSSIVVIISIFCIYKGVLVANMCYARLDNLHGISDEIALRVLDRIESCEGFEGTEDVVFVGDVTQSDYFTNSRYNEGYGDLEILDGIWTVGGEWANTFLYESYLPIRMKENTETNLGIDYYYDNRNGSFDEDQAEIIHYMPDFPADGSVRKMGSNIVVKFCD